MKLESQRGPWYRCAIGREEDMKKIWLIAAMSWLACFSGNRAEAKVTLDSGYAMLVVPARYSVIQIMMDVIDQRPCVLVAYQSDPALPGQYRVDVWNGQAWLEVNAADLADLNFVRVPPANVVLVGSDSLVPPEVLSALELRPDLVRIYDVDNASIVNDLDPVFSWNRREWAWFAARYNLALEDEAAAYRNSSWYDQPGPLTRNQDQDTFVPAPPVTRKSVVIEPVVLDEPVREEIRHLGEPVEKEATGLEQPELNTPAPVLPSPRLSEPLPMDDEVVELDPAPVVESVLDADSPEAPLK